MGQATFIAKLKAQGMVWEGGAMQDDEVTLQVTSEDFIAREFDLHRGPDGLVYLILYCGPKSIRFYAGVLPSDLALRLGKSLQEVGFQALENPLNYTERILEP